MAGVLQQHRVMVCSLACFQVGWMLLSCVRAAEGGVTHSRQDACIQLLAVAMLGPPLACRTA
jgi:hypothetical protein